MSYLRLLAWLILLVIAIYVALHFVSEWGGKAGGFIYRWRALPIECSLGKQLNVDPVHGLETSYITVGNETVLPGRRGENIAGVVKGSAGYVDPWFYFNVTSLYKALHAVRVRDVNRSYALAPLPYSESQDESWVDEKALCLVYYLYYASPVEPVGLAHDPIANITAVEILGRNYTVPVIRLPYLPAANVTVDYDLTVNEKLVEAFVVSWYVAEIEERVDCTYSDVQDVYLCNSTRVHSIKWYVYMYDTLGNSLFLVEDYVYDPYEHELLYASREGLEFMGYKLARAVLVVARVTRTWSNGTHVFTVYDASISVSSQTRGFKVYSYGFYANVSWTPLYGLNPRFRRIDDARVYPWYVVSFYADPLYYRARGSFVFVSEDMVRLDNALGEHVEKLEMVRRVVQLNITYDSENPVVEVSEEFEGWRGYGAVKPYLNITLVKPPAINATEISLNLWQPDRWLAAGYLESTSRFIIFHVYWTFKDDPASLSTFEHTYRYFYSAQLLSSTLTVDYVPAKGVDELIALLLAGMGRQEVKSDALSSLLRRLGVKHSVKEGTSLAYGYPLPSRLIYADVGAVPELWELPSELYATTDSSLTVLYDPWQNSVFCSFRLIIEGVE
ncbi:MAG: hypothetical protein QXQ90_07365 [Desulfurococcaceae archaeon]